MKSLSTLSVLASSLVAAVTSESSKHTNCIDRCLSLRFKVAAVQRRGACIKSCDLHETLNAVDSSVDLKDAVKNEDCVNSCTRAKTLQRTQDMCIERCPVRIVPRKSELTVIDVDIVAEEVADDLGDVNVTNKEDSVLSEDDRVSFNNKTTSWRGVTLDSDYNNDCVSRCYKLRARIEDCLDGCKLTDGSLPHILNEDYEISTSRELSSSD